MITYWTVSFYDDKDELLGAVIMPGESMREAVFDASDFVEEEELLSIAHVTRIECKKGLGAWIAANINGPLKLSYSISLKASCPEGDSVQEIASTGVKPKRRRQRMEPDPEFEDDGK